MPSWHIHFIIKPFYLYTTPFKLICQSEYTLMKNIILNLFFGNQQKHKEPVTNKNFSITNTDLASLDELKFVFYQAEKRLEDSHKTYDSTTGKSITLITLTVAIFSTLAAFFFLHNDTSGSFDPKLFTVLILSFYIFYILTQLIRNILPGDYQPNGTLPSDLLNKQFYDGRDKTPEDENVLKDMYYSELVNYDFRIKDNFNSNSPRLGRIRRSIILLVTFPLIGLIIYLITSFLFY